MAGMRTGTLCDPSQKCRHNLPILRTISICAPKDSPAPMSATPSPSTNRPIPARPAAGGGHDPYAHTRVVRAARIALPAVAGLVLLTVFVWPLFGGSSDKTRPGPAQGDLELTQARYLGTDTSDQPFEIKADRVAQQGGGGSIVDLTAPQADITLKRGAWLAMAAQQGRYDQDSQVLALMGNVSFFHGSGYELRTQEATLDVKRNLAWGNRPVEGQGPMGTVEAGGFRVLNDGDVLVFTGHARLRAFGAGGKADDNDKPGETAP